MPNVKDMVANMELKEFERQLNSWDFKKCLEFIRGIKSKKVSAEKEKIKLVKKRMESMLQSVSLDQMSEFYNNYNNCEDIYKKEFGDEFFYSIDDEFLKRLAKITDGKKRKNLFLKRNVDVDVDVDVNTLIGIVKTKSPSIKKELNKHLSPDVLDQVEQAAVYLWLSGYDIDELLGMGGYGVVWSLKNNPNKVVKYITKREGVELELGNIRELESLKKQNSKYLNIPHIGKSFNITTAPKGKHDWLSKIGKKESNGSKGYNNIEPFIRMGKQVLKALKELHDAGYSHNDIKTENILKVGKDVEAVRRKIQEGKRKKGDEKQSKIYKTKSQLIDFGLISKIDDVENQPTGRGTQGFKAPDVHDVNPKAVAKRDVYSLGATLKELTFGDMNFVIDKNDTNLNAFCQCEHDEQYVNTSVENLKKYFILLRDMTEESYTNRPSVEEALKRIRALKGN